MSHVSELLFLRFGRPVLLRPGRMPQARGMTTYLREGYGEFREPKFECGCCETLVVRVCCTRQNFYVFSLYRNHDQDDRIFESLLTSTAAMQAENARASFLFVGHLNEDHYEWLGSTTPNQHGIVAIDFATVSGWDQLVVGSTQARGGTFDLLMTDVPNLVQVVVVAHIGN